MGTPLAFLLVFTVLISVGLAWTEALSLRDGLVKNLEIFPPMEKTKYIQVSQVRKNYALDE